MKNLKLIFSDILAIVFGSLLLASAANAKDLNAQLYDAVQFQDPFKIRQLIAKGANVNFKNNGRPMIVWAAQGFSTDSVKALLEAKADINQPDESLGHTALMRAVDMQNIEMIKLLLENRANPNIKNKDGDTAFYMAVFSGKPQIVELLVNAGADPKIQRSDADPVAILALQFNASDSPAMLRLLAKAAADMNASNAIYTPIAYAVEQNNYEIVKLLVELGADVNLKAPDDNTPLGLAISANKLEIAKFLLDKKADPDARLAYDTTPLSKAIDNRSIEAVKMLIAAGVVLDKPNISGRTPLEYAEQNYVEEAVELIKQNLPASLEKDAESAGGATNSDKTFSAHEPVTRKCTMVEAAKDQMKLHTKLQEKVNTGKLSSDVFHTFMEDTKGYADMLARDPSEACSMFDRLAKKYSVDISK